MAKAKASVPVEELMEFVEQPLTYGEARRGVWKFERGHKISSAELFSGKCGSFHPDVNADVLFEWKSYYDFVCEVDRRVASALSERRKLEEVTYSSKPSSETRHQTPEQSKQASMSYAA
jgi:hypothetical protein